MKIALVSDIHNGKLIEHRPGYEALKNIEKFIEVCRKESVDCIIELGDRVNNEDHQHDVIYTAQVMSLFKDSGIPVISTIGNHDIHNIEKAEDLSIIGEASPYFHVDSCGFRLVVLDTADPIVGDCGGGMSSVQLDWLQELLETTSSDLPILLFSHHPLIDQNQDGNPFFVNIPGEYRIVENSERIDSILREFSSRILGAFNGHVHWNYLKYRYGIPFFSVASLTEAYPSFEEAPGRFSMLTIHDDNTVDITSEMLNPYRILGRFEIR